MDSSLTDVLKQICNECGLNESDAYPSLKILHANFFFKLKDVKNLNFESWKYLNLPLNLFFILQGKINMCEGNINNMNTSPFITNTAPISTLISTQPTLITSPSAILPKDNEIILNPDINKPIPVDIKKEETKPIQKAPSMIQNINKQPSGIIQPQIPQEIEPPKKEDLLKDQIYSNLDKLVREINDKEKTVDVLRKIHTILLNIITNPLDGKFRKLKIDSKFVKTYIEPYKNALNFLSSINFEISKDGQYYEYLEDEKFLSKVADNFNDYLIERKIASLNFNPYQTSIISINPLQPKQGQTADFDELMRLEVSRRDEIVRNSTQVERKTKIFEIKTTDSMGSVLQSLNEQDGKDDEKKYEEDDFFKYATNLIRTNTDKFTIKRKTEFEKFLKKPIYTKATVRIKFPNEILIQANFAMMEKIQDIYNFVRENLNDSSQDFVLFTSFPAKKYTDMKATVYSQGLAPSTLLYISFPNIDPLKELNYQYLNPSAIEKYKTEFKIEK